MKKPKTQINNHRERLINFNNSVVFLIVGILMGILGGVCASYIYDYAKERNKASFLALFCFIGLMLLFREFNNRLKEVEKELNKVNKK